jgi:hypothetical protein
MWGVSKSTILEKIIGIKGMRIFKIVEEMH